VLERAAERCHERTELRDAAAVFVASHEVMIAARPGGRCDPATGRAMSNIGHGEQ
jgi:hypothetical protein